MRKVWLFTKNLYVLLILLASDPFDVAERWFGVSYQPPSFLFWLLLALAIGVAIYLTYRNVRKSITYHQVAWEVYDKLSEEFRNLLSSETEKDRNRVFALIERERGKLPDKRMDEIINAYLAADRERARYGMNPINDVSQHALSLCLERMRNHIRGKYGERKPETEYNLQIL